MVLAIFTAIFVKKLCQFLDQTYPTLTQSKNGQNKICKCEDFAEKSINAGHFFPSAQVTLNRVSILFGLILHLQS